MENTESLDADVILPGAEFRRMRAEIEALQRKVAWYQERLEIDRVWQWNPDMECAVEVEVPPEKRDSMPDGIDCRDETIKGIDADRDRLAAENARLTTDVGRLREMIRTVVAAHEAMQSAIDEKSIMKTYDTSKALHQSIAAARSLTEAQP